MSETPSTPGSQALMKLKEQDAALVEFKKPNFPAKKKKPKILSEEKYIEELSKIIQRDFFPDLERLRAQNDYLDAMDRKDYTLMEAIRAKYSSGRRPTERSGATTPATFETPALIGSRTPRAEDTILTAPSDTPKSTISTDSKASSAEGGRRSIVDKHSLDSFLQAYTSEDNHSFQEIIETAEQKLRQKFAVLFNEEKLSADKLALALTLPSIEKQFEEPDPMRKIETWTYRNMNSIMYTPDGVELTAKERMEAAARKQAIQHNATRFQANPFDDTQSQKAVSELAKNQTQTTNDKIGVDGNLLGANNPAPQVRGFELIGTPSPRPGEAFSPLMTWGEIEGTPFRLDGSDTPIRSNAGPSFKIAENSRRENIAIELAEKVGEKMRAQKQRAMNTARKNIGSPFIRSNMERLASMSPAARRLATSKLGLRTPILTPSPLRTPLPTAKRKDAALGQKPSGAPTLTKKTPTPVSGATTPRTPKQISAGKSTLTDDLLNIPTKRMRAADFF